MAEGEVGDGEDGQRVGALVGAVHREANAITWPRAHHYVFWRDSDDSDRDRGRRRGRINRGDRPDYSQLKQKDSIEAIDTDEAPAIKVLSLLRPPQSLRCECHGDASGGRAASSAEEARRAKERGNKRFAGRQYEMAIAEYTKAIDLGDPTDPEVAKYYGNRAQCHACLEQHAHAESDCDAALKCDPSYVKALARRATAREKLDNTDGALVDFTATLLLSGMNHPSASESIDRLVKKIAAQKADQRLKEPMRCLPSPSFIATFVDSFREHRLLLEAPAERTSSAIAAALEGAEGAARAGLLVERAVARMRVRQYEGAMAVWGAAGRRISPLGDAVAEVGDAATPAAMERARARLMDGGNGRAVSISRVINARHVPPFTW